LIHSDPKAEATRKGRFAVVIPLYNHEDMAAAVIREVLQLGFPVIVVDDGSTDDSFDHVRGIDDIIILRHTRNCGKGAALLTGMAEATGIADWAIAIDADGQHTPFDAFNLIQAIPEGQRPIVIGDRQGMDAADVHWTSRFGRQFSNFWVWTSCGRWVADSQSGFRIYPLPETLQLGVKSRRYQFEVEVLVKARWKSLPIIEAAVQVNYSPGARRVSHFRPFIDFMRNSKTFSRLITQRLFIPLTLRRRWASKESVFRR
jgi:glycosyltransferase involved in cell wall biosynthesis